MIPMSTQISKSLIALFFQNLFIGKFGRIGEVQLQVAIGIIGIIQQMIGPKSLIALFFLGMFVTGCNTNTKQTADNDIKFDSIRCANKM